MFLTIIVFVLIISFLVGIHEFGHYYAARKFGMKVEEFAIGMGPAIFKYTSKKTGILYSVRCIPIGGFCKIKGENGGNSEEIDKIEPNKEDSQPLVTNTQLDSDSFGAKKIWQRSVVLSAGVFMNLIFAILFIYIGLIIGTPTVISPDQSYNNAKISNERLLIKSVLPGSSAEKIGIKSGDEILMVNGQNTKESNALNTSLKDANEVNMTLKDSAGKEKIISSLKKEFNKDLNKDIFGIEFAQIGVVSYNPIQAIPKTFVATGFIIKETFRALGYMLSNIFAGHGIPDGLTGPIGITFITGDAMKQGFTYVISLVAQLSLSLAIMNIIPFPALDGGRILFLAFEKIKGGPLNEKFELIANGVGFLLLIVLIITVTFKDIATFILK